MLFMFQNVAVPHIVIPASSCADRRPGGNFEFHNDLRHFSRVHSDRFLPPHLVRIGRARGSVESRRAVVVLRIERLPLQNLDVDQVEVDGMGISSQIEDPPDFRVPRSRGLRGRVHVVPGERFSI